ncbi:MAG: hypothetical protein V2I67_17695 [Thermoanaerobaculales bacterium]|nr:hypothetical protein [Thermoanaerobaculales bacterium]
MHHRFCSVLSAALITMTVTVLPLTAQERLSENRLDPRFADTPMITDPFDFNLGGFLIDLNTSAAIGGSGGLGSVIRLEELLGLDANQSLLRLGFRWDFAHRHSIGLTWFSISRGASGHFDEYVDFVDLRFVGDYESEFDVDFYGLEYRYSLINNNRIDAGFSAGISTFDIYASIEGEAHAIGDVPSTPVIEYRRADADIIAPVPGIGIFLDYALTKKLIISSGFQFVDLSISGYDGRFVDSRVTLDWFFTRHFAIGGGLAATDIQVAYTGDDPYRIDYSYSGILFHVRGSF